MSPKKTTSKLRKEARNPPDVWRRPFERQRRSFCPRGNPSNGYTTILKLMQIMHEKGLLTRQKQGIASLQGVTFTGKHEPATVHKMIETVFQGSAAQLVLMH